MLKTFKTEINPTPDQISTIDHTIGVCRYIYNLYISRNKELYDQGGEFVSGRKFSVWLNNEYIPDNPDKRWIKEVSSKAVKQAIMNGETAFKRFFRGMARFPRYKKRGKSDVKMYFVKNSKTDCLCERHRIKIPTLGWIRLKEKGYIPVSKDGFIIRSGTVSRKAGRYYVSALVEVPDVENTNNKIEGIGIDLGIKNFATVSSGKVYANINKTDRVRKLEKQLCREQRKLSRKLESKTRGLSEKGANIQKQKVKVERLYQRLTNIRIDYINKIVSEIVKGNPEYIVIEDLNVRGMMKNRHLSKAIASQKFYEFREKLKRKCKEFGIELRIADRWYPSSKLCHHCGSIKEILKLSERTYTCDCGYENDRDLNASLNLRDILSYSIV